MLIPLLLAVVACTVFGVWVIYEKTRDVSSHVVKLTPDGFSPAFLAVETGDTVIFKTENGEAFWPASDEHPSHLSFPEFDPKKPIAPNEEWSFTFAKAGTYGFHDHIYPEFKGRILVGKEGTIDKTLEVVTFDECLHMSPIGMKVSCWTVFLDHKIQTLGVVEAFKVFTDVYNADPEFVALGCHGAVHLMGEEAYDLYKEGGTVEFATTTTVCGYGFYHGFLGKLLHDKPDLNEAVKFCEALRDSYNGGGHDGIYQTCFHGIGHGMVEESPLPEYYWGNADALIDPALKACGLLPTADQQRQCADGAFNGLTRFMVFSLFGFTYNTDDPLGWCERFKNNRINYVSCYFELSQHFATQEKIMHGGNIADILPYIEGLDPEVQFIVVETAVGGLMQVGVTKEDNSEYFERCSVFPVFELEYACLRGIVTGYFNFGEPGNEAPKAREFCSSPNATEKQRAACEEILATFTG